MRGGSAAKGLHLSALVESPNVPIPTVLDLIVGVERTGDGRLVLRDTGLLLTPVPDVVARVRSLAGQ